ncbi:tRNA-splicing endonuclease subunit sen54 [Apophysomyces ossiformis]|uniref:tRNA-splicing endonuclease subunit sen54 n=1 Tax=Apophysomyces ossiformis TaxID=679940 RepID=A0A8H7EMU6_9FUNG|nr:tRNA-splicing endonuclease subunit sen54 [Apophysomyces ossiformis]
MSDSDESDETPDFSVLLNKNRRKGKLTRGVKDFEPHPSSTQDIAVANARNALFQVIGEEKKPNKKSTSAGIFDSSTGLTTVIQNKGTHLHTMGHTQNGKIMLYPEEAAWLLSRSALIATDIHNTPCPMAAYYQFMFGRGDGWITYEKYQDMPLSLTEYGQLSDQVVPTCSGKQPSIRHTKYGGQCSFLVALVDDVEGVTFLRVATDGLADISIGDIV